MVDYMAIDSDPLRIPSTSEPDVILPSQYFGALKSGNASGEMRLCLAILLDAIRCFQLGHIGVKKMTCSSRNRPSLYKKAEQWIFSGDEADIFSFINVCGVLGLEPDALRGNIDKWRKGESKTAFPIVRVKQGVEGSHAVIVTKRRTKRKNKSKFTA